MSDVFPEGQPEETSAREEREALQAWHKYGKYPYLLAKFAFFGAICVLLFVCLRTVESVAFPLFLSLLTAYLLDPLIDRFEEKNIDRTLAIAIVILLMGLGFVLLVLVLYPLVARQVINVAQKFPTLLDTLQTKVIPWLQSQAGFEMPVNLQTAVTQYGEELKSAAPTIFKKVGDWGTGLLTQTGVIVASLLNLIMIPIFTFYFLRDFDRMKDGAAQFIPLYRRGVVVDRLYKIDDVVGAWFRGQIQVSLILAALYGVGLGTAFAVTGHEAFDGFALGAISGLLNVIPYVGFAVGFVLSVLVVLIEWTGWGSLIGVLIVFSVVQGLEGYVITPKVVGEKVGLSPVAVIIVLLLGGELAGLLGVLLAIPVAGAFKVLLPDIIGMYRQSAYFTGSDPSALEMMHHDDLEKKRAYKESDAVASTTAQESPPVDDASADEVDEAESLDDVGELEGEEEMNDAVAEEAPPADDSVEEGDEEASEVASKDPSDVQDEELEPADVVKPSRASSEEE